MTNKIICGEAAARIGRLIGLETEAATAELKNNDFPWEFIISAYASDSSAEVIVDYIDENCLLSAIFVRSFPLLKKQVFQMIDNKNPVLCSERYWDPEGDPFCAKGEPAEPFISGDAHTRIREAYDEFMAALALAAEEREKVK